jgi:flagellar biosynthesis anti-sigma factor FlgM
MKITQRGPADTDLSQLVQNDNTINQVRRYSDPKVQQGGKPAKINISKEALELQKIAELARTGDELRAQRVNQIKEQIANGQYQADSKEVSKSIIRSEVSGLLHLEAQKRAILAWAWRTCWGKSTTESLGSAPSANLRKSDVKFSKESARPILQSHSGKSSTHCLKQDPNACCLVNSESVHGESLPGSAPKNRTCMN